MITYDAKTPAGTAYCTERREGMVGVVMPHQFMTSRIIEIMRWEQVAALAA